MADKPTITPEEAELLSQEGELLAKKEQGQNLDKNESETLERINSLKEDLKKRFGEEKDTPEQTEQRVKEITLQAQKEHWRRKAKKGEELIAELRQKIENKPTSEKSEEKKESTLTEIKEWQEKVNFLLTHKDVSEAELEHIATVALRKGVSLKEAYELPEVKSYITFMRQQVDKGKKTPEPETRSPEIEGKPISEMTRKEKEEKYPEIVARVLKGKVPPKTFR